MKIFLTINFIMSLVLMSCDAGMMSSESSIEIESKPMDIVGAYENKIEGYYAKVTKDENAPGDYLLEFSDTGSPDEINKFKSCEYNIDEKSFTFKIGIRPIIKYHLVFKKEGYPVLIVDNIN